MSAFKNTLLFLLDYYRRRAHLQAHAMDAYRRHLRRYAYYIDHPTIRRAKIFQNEQITNKIFRRRIYSINFISNSL